MTPGLPVGRNLTYRPMSSPYFDCRLTRFELGLLFVVIGLTITLHLTPVLYSPVGVGLLVAIAALCWLTPVTGFFFLSCGGAIMPAPAYATMMPAMIGFLAWLVVAPLRYNIGFSLRGITWLAVLIPYFIWATVMTGSTAFLWRYIAAMSFAVIACQLANASQGRYLKCLLGFSLGAFMATVGFWVDALGLPVELSEWGGVRSEFVRLGSIRLDSVSMWYPTFIAVSGLLGIPMALLAAQRRPHRAIRMLHLGVLALLLCIPPLVSTMTYASYAGFALLISFLCWELLRLYQKRLISGAHISIFLRYGLVAAFLLGIMIATNTMRLRDKIGGTWSHYSKRAEETGGLGTRSAVWESSLRTIGKYPLFGVSFYNVKEPLPAWAGARHKKMGYYLSHNVFLDIGRSSGIPGMLLYAGFFFLPFYRMCRSPKRSLYLPFLLAFFSTLIFLMTLSFNFNKMWWAFWMLMMMASPRRR